MLVNYNITELKNALSDFYEATGSAIVLMDSEFNTIVPFDKINNPFCRMVHSSKEGKSRCWKSDMCLTKKCAESGKLELHTCHAGLTDAAVPINYKNSVVGYIILGQMRSDTDFEDIYKRISDLSIEYEAAKSSYEMLTVSTEERMKSVANIATMLTQYILFKNLITEYQNKTLTDAMTYISANFNKDLDIESICEKLHVSKSVLYRNFHKYMNCTVGEYINRIRVEHAKVFILNTNKSLQEISGPLPVKQTEK